MIPYKKTSKTPYELWKGYAPNIVYLKVQGCLAKVLFLKPNKLKLGPKTFDTMFIRYAENSATYKFLVIKSENNLAEVNTIMETKNVDFFENIFPMKPSGREQIQRTLRVEFNKFSKFEPRTSKIDKEINKLWRWFLHLLNR